MEFNVPQYKDYAEDFNEITKAYSLNPEHTKVEFYTPKFQAILTEQVEDQIFKIHINLEEKRIISIERLSKNGNGHSEALKEKYRKFMK